LNLDRSTGLRSFEVSVNLRLTTDSALEQATTAFAYHVHDKGKGKVVPVLN